MIKVYLAHSMLAVYVLLVMLYYNYILELFVVENYNICYVKK